MHKLKLILIALPLLAVLGCSDCPKQLEQCQRDKEKIQQDFDAFKDRTEGNEKAQGEFMAFQAQKMMEYEKEIAELKQQLNQAQ